MPNEPATTGKRKREPSHRMPLDECQTRLATIWVVGLGVCLLVLMGQTVGGRYQADYLSGNERSQIYPEQLPERRSGERLGVANRHDHGPEIR